MITAKFRNIHTRSRVRLEGLQHLAMEDFFRRVMTNPPVDSVVSGPYSIIVDVNASLEKVWDVLGDFANIAWMQPGTAPDTRAELEETSKGLVRNYEEEGGNARDLLLCRDPTNHFTSFRVLVSGGVEKVCEYVSIRCEKNSEKTRVCLWGMQDGNDPQEIEVLKVVIRGLLLQIGE